MAKADANLKFDDVKGTATVALSLSGTTEFEHELLAQFFKGRQVSLVPFNNGDQLESRFVIEDKQAFGLAWRAVQNRIRVRDGRPTLEQEEAFAESQKAQPVKEPDAKAANK